MLCCLSCHRKTPWLSYFKPLVPLVRGTWKILKKRLSAHLTPPPPGQQTTCSCCWLQRKAERSFNTELFTHNRSDLVCRYRKSLFTCCPHFVHWWIQLEAPSIVWRIPSEKTSGSQSPHLKCNVWFIILKVNKLFFLTGSGFSGLSHTSVVLNVPVYEIKTRGGERDTQTKTNALRPLNCW